VGEDADGTRQVAHKRPSLGGILLSDTFEVIASFYELKNGSAFHELTEYLVGLSCRDQEDEYIQADLALVGDPGLSQRRAEGHQLARAVVSHALRASESLDAIFGALERFDAIVQMHPPLLEAIFDTDTGDPRSLTMPDNLAILLHFSDKVDWSDAWDALRSLASIPVKMRLARGPVNNQTLRRAVAACRTYWQAEEGHSWSMSSLKSKAVRDENEPCYLQGRCEAFVSDILTQTGIMHGLQDLCSAWTAVDRP
jgi:hypothetical protein